MSQVSILLRDEVILGNAQEFDLYHKKNSQQQREYSPHILECSQVLSIEQSHTSTIIFLTLSAASGFGRLKNAFQEVMKPLGKKETPHDFDQPLLPSSRKTKHVLSQITLLRIQSSPGFFKYSINMAGVVSHLTSSQATIE